MDNNKTPTFADFVEIWNKDQNLKTPDHHRTMCSWLADRWKQGDRELLLMAFRNSGKSTIVGLFCAWLLAVDPAVRIMVLAADLSLARKMTRNVKRIIERHPACAGLKPTRADQWASDQFTVNRDTELRDPSMLAKGITTNVTGSRADIVICDDVEVPNTCDTEAKREDLRERLNEIEYVLVPGGLQLYIGTPHTFNSIYAKVARADVDEDRPFLSGFHRLEIPIYDDQGRSRWSERFSDKKIAEIQRRSGPAKFRSQMLLEPVDIAEGRLDPDRFKYYGGEIVYSEQNGQAVLTLEGRRLISATCWWDPSYGSPDKGDRSVVACVYTSEDGYYWLHRIEYQSFDPKRLHNEPEAEQLCRKVARFARDLYLPSVTVETNGIGRFLPAILLGVMAKENVSAAVVGVHSKTPKDVRILEAFDAPLAAGRIFVHEQVRATPFIAEMREWKPNAKARDDGLDAVAGCLLSEPVRLPRNPHALGGPSRPNWTGGGGAFQAHTTFEP